jgi:imidazolonepropionase
MGNRALEFEMRLEGKTYMEIMQAGGGIVNTVKATRQASVTELKQSARKRLDGMLKHGTTTAEVKSGYGLEFNSEIAQMQAILELDAEQPIDLAPTFLGAHAIPPEFQNDPQGYTREISDRMLPGLLAWWRANAPDKTLPFVDVFCETGAFSLDQTRQIFESALRLGFPLKIHADEFDNLGGVSLAVEMGAISADHVVKTSAQDIAALGRSNTVAVALPPTPFGLAQSEYTPARRILEAAGALAIASDLNPGTAWCENMQFVIALACRYLKISPAQAIAAATINAAAAIGRAEQIGSLEPGKQADLILLSGGDYRNLGYQFGSNQVTRVMKRGQWAAINDL